MKKIIPKENIDCKVRIPGSKSITHRALIAASLAKGKSRLKSFLSCEDILYTAGALKKMGTTVEIDADTAVVHGKGGIFPAFNDMTTIDLGNSGTSYRLLLSVAALSERGTFEFTGSERMQKRPVEYLVNALKSIGVSIDYVNESGFPPVLIKASGIKGGKVRIPGNISSQYISSLLLSGPYTKTGLEIEVTGELVSRPYIDLTLDTMKAFGINVNNSNYQSFFIAPGQIYKAQKEYTVEGDASSASYFWGAAAVTGGTVKTENIHPLKTRQGDIKFLEILDRMGCSVKRHDDYVTVRGGLLSGIKADMGSMPDMAPTLAVIALFAKGETTIYNVSHLKHKESDRIADTANELRRIGGRVQELDDGLIIYGGEALRGAEIDPHDDHRLAMGFSMAGLRVPGIVIKNEGCVNKSFPAFWELWKTL